MIATSGLEDSVERLAGCDHACAFYASDDERRRAVVAFARAGLAKNERLIYLASDRREDEVFADLALATEDVRSRADAGQVRVLFAGDRYAPGGGFDQGETIASMVADSEVALDDGWSGLRVAGEMSWALDAGLDPRVLADYERGVDDAISHSRLTGLCLYDTRRFDQQLIRDTGHLHPLVLCESSFDDPYTARVERAEHGGLVVAGEIDLASAGALAQSIRAEATRRSEVTLDLSALDFIDVAALRSLYAVGRELEGRGVRLNVIRANPFVQRVASLLDLTASGPIRWEEAA